MQCDTDVPASRRAPLPAIDHDLKSQRQKAATCRTCVSWHTMGARLRLVIVGVLASTIAAKKADGCSATATYPDGTEIERCVAISSSAATPSRTHLFSLKCARSQHIIASRVYAYRSECMVIGEGGSRGAKAEAPKKGISEEMAWLKDTRWLWNDWREVSISRACTRARTRFASLL